MLDWSDPEHLAVTAALAILMLVVIFFGVPMVANAAPSHADWWLAKAEGAFARGERFFGSLRTRCAERRRRHRK
ncbi:hypothetical protein J7I98_08565 [Streptomyces sp. ISL-98]|uniref:hypothetical protein n=1 Tax=Streptomyces sp. ISL-98 TaxID=2819192 RepID=UPI001BE78D0B|nr:hypothetical protein [Streptomyces sp. ISL-98]MBT2505945.1 hypothetical protein [Streptomyces sp. ISL-98]